jgi:hypothetical protein
MKNDMDDKKITESKPLQIGTDAQGARLYLGCTNSVFKDLRRRGYVPELRPNWYIYDDLDHCVERLREERNEKLRRVREEGMQNWTLLSKDAQEQQ